MKPAYSQDPRIEASMWRARCEIERKGADREIAYLRERIDSLTRRLERAEAEASECRKAEGKEETGRP